MSKLLMMMCLFLSAGGINLVLSIRFDEAWRLILVVPCFLAAFTNYHSWAVQEKADNS